MRLRHLLTASAAFGIVSSCTHAPAPVAVAVAAPEPAPMPQPPADLPQTMRVPARLADGSYATINRGVSAAGAVWHLRSALNVAALACRGPEEATMIAAYNQFLRSHKAVLAGADKALQAEFRARAPLVWQADHDEHLTRVYNFFSQPLDPRGFCVQAMAVVAQAETVPDADFPTYAAGALAQLEAPFTTAYARWDDYRTRLAAWQAGNAPLAPRLEYASINDVMAWTPLATNMPVRTAALR